MGIGLVGMQFSQYLAIAGKGDRADSRGCFK